MVLAICCAKPGGPFHLSNAFFADAGYQGPKLAKTVRRPGIGGLKSSSERRPSLRNPAKTLDRRTDILLDQPQSPPRPRLRAYARSVAAWIRLA